jgi:FKBP-type peptidyl-prolyl cis-trans isomerase
MYKVLKQGNGPSPKKTDVVRTHYLGRFTDGTEFDNSYKRNQPAEFPLDQVIPGWTEALQLMKVGDRWQLVLPPNLAYGEQGSPPAIGPDAVLIFDIELLGIAPPGEPGLPTLP